MIPQAFIDDLLSRVDVVDVVGRHVKLRKAGADLQGLCPFHNEKTPSFTVSPSKQFYHCFGCGAHGSAIGFLMEHAGLGYVDAIEDLAQSVGLTVPHESGGGRRPTPSEAPGLMDLLGSASRYYQRRLRESDAAINYLKGRGLSGQTAARFALGYAPPGWRNLEAAVPDYNDAALVRAGLVKESGGDDDAGVAADSAESTELTAPSAPSRKRYDRFRHRVMFPIRNPRGGIIGFGGRVIDDGQPKYLNSPETPVFSKGRELYGLFEGRTELRNLNQALVVEGYMDVVMLAEHGIGHAVATLGTATTTEHIRKLLRIVDSLVFCFDGDRAGKKAAWRALQTCLPIISDTQRVQFLFLPDGEDPDSYVRQNGADGFREAVAAAQPLSGFMLDHLSAAGDLDSPEGRARLVAEARPLLAAFSAEGMRMQMTREVADLAGIGLVQMQQYLSQEPAGQGRRQGGQGNGQNGGGQYGGGQYGGGQQGGQNRWQKNGRSGRNPESGNSSYGGSGAPYPRRGQRRPPSNRRGAVRAGSPNLARRLRLLMVCHPVLAHGLTGDAGPGLALPDGLDRWVQALGALAGDAPLAATVSALREAGLDGIADVERDLAADWGSVTQLSPDEARVEFDGALDQVRRRIASEAARQAARELQQAGLQDEQRRQALLEILASQKRS